MAGDEFEMRHMKRGIWRSTKQLEPVLPVYSSCRIRRCYTMVHRARHNAPTPDTRLAYMPRYTVAMVSLVQWQRHVNPSIRRMAFVSRKGSS